MFYSGAASGVMHVGTQLSCRDTDPKENTGTFLMFHL